MNGLRDLLRILLLLSVSPMLWAQTAPSFVGATQNTNGGSASAVAGIILSRPAGVVPGDLMIAYVATTGGSGQGFSVPSGWTLLRRDNNSGLSAAIWTRVAGAAEDTSWTWLFSSDQRTMGGIIAYRDVDISVAISHAGSAPAGTGTSVSAPSVAAVANARVLTFFANGNGNNAFAGPAAMDELLGGEGTGAGPNGLTAGAAQSVQAVDGTSGARTASLASTAAPRIGQTVILPPGAGVSLDHIRILHSGSAVTCEPASITVQACADATCSTLFPDPVSVTLGSSPVGSWSANPISVTGSATVSLSVSSMNTVTLSATSTPAATNATQCWNGGTQTCQLSFTDTAFVFSAIPTQTAGTASAAVTLRAIRSVAGNPTACEAALSGTQTVQLGSQCLNPTTCAGRQVSIGGTAIASNPAASLTAYTGVTLDFGSNATASFTLTYPDVGQIRLAARHTVANGTQLSGTSAAFVVRPAGFVVSAIASADGSVANPAATDATGTAFIAAGQPFRATVTAVTSSGAATPNFGRESAPQGVQLDHSLHAPTGGNNPTLSNASIAGGQFSAGVATKTDLAWSEVGIIQVTPRAAGNDYLGTGAVSGTTSATIGRFIADHFDVSLSDGCTGGAFTYAGLAAGQPFPVSVIARPAAGAPNVTSNYTGDFARATTLSQPGASPIAGVLANPVIDASDFDDGVADVVDTSFSITNAQFEPADLTLRATDTDGVSSAGHTEGSTQLRSGRLWISNGVGSNLLPSTLALPVQVQSWQDIDPPNGVYDWNVEAADTCTTITTADFAVVGEAAITAVTALSSGVGAVTLTPSGNVGNADVTGLMSTLAPWLQFDWDGDGSADDPVARAAFGLNPGNPQQIFRREVIPGN